MAKELGRREAAQYLTTEHGLQVTWTYLQNLPATVGGPRYRRFGRETVYLPEDLDEWAESRLSPPRYSTSEAA